MREIRRKKTYQEEGFKAPVFEYLPDWPYISIGFGDERDYFIENLSLLISSGMGISSALEALRLSVRTRKMKRITGAICEMVEDGSPLWQAFETTRLLPEKVISLIRAGEEAGKLPEHLNLVTLQQHKDRLLRTRVRSSLLYPGIVLFLAIVMALFSAWNILPTLTGIYAENSSSSLPATTRSLIWFGWFLKAYGAFVIPAAVALVAAAAYLLFVNRRFKFMGDAILFRIPGVKTLVQGVEVARFGFTFGALLQAGFQVDQALESLKMGTSYDAYRSFYEHLRANVVQGESLEKSMRSYRAADRLVPVPIQQLIFSAEKSGKLPETLIKIGVIFEEKTESMAKDLVTVLEPIVLIIVGILVAYVVTGVITPIYGLTTQY